MACPCVNTAYLRLSRGLTLTTLTYLVGNSLQLKPWRELQTLLSGPGNSPTAGVRMLPLSTDHVKHASVSTRKRAGAKCCIMCVPESSIVVNQLLHASQSFWIRRVHPSSELPILFHIVLGMQCY